MNVLTKKIKVTNKITVAVPVSEAEVAIQPIVINIFQRNTKKTD